MRPIIEFCVNNMHHGTDKVMKRLEGNPEYDVLEYGCLGNCGECYMFPFALVNGEIVAGETADELYDKIMNKIDEIKAWEQLDID
ncbi:YuzB family protein [Paenibacillus alvei]|uniref:YuzB family protein n=1 Tax=Paenibacillus alvei TaxID=44250 RepID=A0AAP6ZWW1_PAEAL|nr:YuzB family protein [Paenibacillus alvei]MBG9734670.1 UDP-N-acetylmuramoylalanine--D-glutamate ligase [Paenibacillus alvei]MBG9743019.1 UDP-N-acetylmuramoylalanine--D-glutamate ligase [Paenibacillus alvei]MCY7483494.1 YuzB family protein [Paenibacillus alvei]MCY9582112.1 YuzB family protein [Paenibacillus alvei]MCY9587660.1 YuzB family protein [Paenibacillus alvei]